jgi:peptide-methionine (S)-S-oxide reductase
MPRIRLILARLFLVLVAVVAPATAVEVGARPATTATIVFGGGCFWFMQTAFQEVPGVVQATVGYAGGTTDRPTYEQVCEGVTGHAEVVEVVYDPAAVGVDRLLGLFFRMHDPSTKDRQGPDVGTQYRSAIFTTDPAQLAAAQAMAARLEAGGQRITTEMRMLPAGPGRFHAAEAEHQDYYRRNPGQPYCATVVRSKLIHFRRLLATPGMLP